MDVGLCERSKGILCFGKRSFVVQLHKLRSPLIRWWKRLGRNRATWKLICLILLCAGLAQIFGWAVGVASACQSHVDLKAGVQHKEWVYPHTGTVYTYGIPQAEYGIYFKIVYLKGNVFSCGNESGCFRTGLYTVRYNGIYTCFDRNRKRDFVKNWYFTFMYFLKSMVQPYWNIGKIMYN